MSFSGHSLEKKRGRGLLKTTTPGETVDGIMGSTRQGDPVRCQNRFQSHHWTFFPGASIFISQQNNTYMGVPSQKLALKKKRGDGSLSDGPWGRGAGYVQIRTLAVCAEACLGSRPQGPKRLPHLRSANQLFFETFKLRGCLGT